MKRFIVPMTLIVLIVAGLMVLLTRPGASTHAETLPASSSSTVQVKEKTPVNFTIETSKGTMSGILYTDKAPVSTQNFIELAESGFYNGHVFHRVEPNFVIQTGDPTGTGTGGSDKRIPLEIHPELRHDAAGVLGMARTQDPNSATSQFYVTLGPTAFLDDNYAVFGRVTEGVEVAQQIQIGDKMTAVTINRPPAD